MSALNYFKYENKTKKCHYCEQFVPLKDRTRDHIIPKSKGEKLHNNIVMACKICNVNRNDIEYNTWFLISKLGLYYGKMSKKHYKRKWFREARHLNREEVISMYQELFYYR
jgi:hypothetical protein